MAQSSGRTSSCSTSWQIHSASLQALHLDAELRRRREDRPMIADGAGHEDPHDVFLGRLEIDAEPPERRR